MSERSDIARTLAEYNDAVQQTSIRPWFATQRVGKNLPRGYFCTVTPP